MLYELRLGKETGAYLPKDIMYDNPKSIALLAGTQIVKSFASLNAAMTLTDHKQKEYSQILSSVDSLAAALRALQEDVLVVEGQSSRLRYEETRLRHEFSAFNEAITEANGRLLEEYAPLLRGLYKSVKEQASQQKEEVFKMEREVRELA